MKQTMHNTRVRWVLGILIALTLAFIWSNSMQSGAPDDQPGGMSGSLKAWLEQLLHTEISEFLLRKAAHFSEYGLLGVEFSLLLGLQHDKNGKNFQHGRNLLDFPLIGMLCAVTDETIQIFSGRGSLVSDVWIDTAGFSTGFFLTVLLFLFINHCKKSRVTGNRKG